MEKKAWPYMAGIMDSEGSISLSIQLEIPQRLTR
jgi:hypothetical protein